jgi:hypothetical protein
MPSPHPICQPHYSYKSLNIPSSQPPHSFFPLHLNLRHLLIRIRTPGPPLPFPAIPMIMLMPISMPTIFLPPPTRPRSPIISTITLITTAIRRALVARFVYAFGGVVDAAYYLFPISINPTPQKPEEVIILPLLFFLPNPSLSTTSSAHCMRGLLVLASASSSLVAPRRCRTGCRGVVVICGVFVVGRWSCVCADVPEEREGAVVDAMA